MFTNNHKAMNDKTYIEEVRQQLEITKIMSGKTPKYHVSDSDILYLRNMGNNVFECVDELLKM